MYVSSCLSCRLVAVKYMYQVHATPSSRGLRLITTMQATRLVVMSQFRTSYFDVIIDSLEKES